MKLYINYPLNRFGQDGHDECGFIDDFILCDADATGNGDREKPCGPELIWEDCSAASLPRYWWCVERNLPVWWCVTTEE